MSCNASWDVLQCALQRVVVRCLSRSLTPRPFLRDVLPLLFISRHPEKPRDAYTNLLAKLPPYSPVLSKELEM